MSAIEYSDRDCDRDCLEMLRDENGRLPAFTWPGGYPITYLMGDGAGMCPDCVNKEGEAGNATTDPLVDSLEREWLIIGHYIHWEGEPEICCNCNAEMPPAYPEDTKPE